MPVADPTVATPVLLLFHVPPATPSVNVVPEPAHTEVVPNIGVGGIVTVTMAVALGKQPVEYVMVAVPGNAPAVTTPVAGSMVATDGLPELQVPPVTASDKLVVELAQMPSRPRIGPGIPVTVITVVS